MSKPNFTAFIREMATKSPDVIRVWQSANTEAEKTIAKRTIIRVGREKAKVRDEIAGFVRHLSLDDLRRVQKHVFDLHTCRMMLSMVAEKGTRKRRKKS